MEHTSIWKIWVFDFALEKKSSKGRKRSGKVRRLLANCLVNVFLKQSRNNNFLKKRLCYAYYLSCKFVIYHFINLPRWFKHFILWTGDHGRTAWDVGWLFPLNGQEWKRYVQYLFSWQENKWLNLLRNPFDILWGLRTGTWVSAVAT